MLDGLSPAPFSRNSSGGPAASHALGPAWLHPIFQQSIFNHETLTRSAAIHSLREKREARLLLSPSSSESRHFQIIASRVHLQALPEAVRVFYWRGKNSAVLSIEGLLLPFLSPVVFSGDAVSLCSFKPHTPETAIAPGNEVRRKLEKQASTLPFTALRPTPPKVDSGSSAPRSRWVQPNQREAPMPRDRLSKADKGHVVRKTSA